jgi:hypothetical protein
MSCLGVRRLYSFNKILSVDCMGKAAEIARSLFCKQVKLLKDKETFM